MVPGVGVHDRDSAYDSAEEFFDALCSKYGGGGPSMDAASQWNSRPAPSRSSTMGTPLWHEARRTPEPRNLRGTFAF